MIRDYTACVFTRHKQSFQRAITIYWPTSQALKVCAQLPCRHKFWPGFRLLIYFSSLCLREAKVFGKYAKG